MQRFLVLLPSVLAILSVNFSFSPPEAGAEEGPPSAMQPFPPVCEPFVLPALRVIPPPSQYADFCRTNPAACEMSGAPVVALDSDTWQLLRRINRRVNAEICFVPDPEEYGFEDFWKLPSEGYGDCEDYALEKRERLAREGLPRAAMRLAIVQHQIMLFSHAVLTIDTTRGALVLDNLHGLPLCWHDAPLNFEARENADGTWTRFDQSDWPLFPLELYEK